MAGCDRCGLIRPRGNPSRTALEEIFDVVDGRDRVVGREPRSRVHARGLKHRAVHVLVFDRHGRIFLQKRSEAKDTFPGMWDTSAAGHLESGEDYDGAAVREIEEELGFSPPRSPERLFKIDACAETSEEFVWVYRLDADGPFILNREEIERGGWFSPETVSAWINRSVSEFTAGFVLIWGMLGSER